MEERAGKKERKKQTESSLDHVFLKSIINN